jgi:hypothetical protein
LSPGADAVSLNQAVVTIEVDLDRASPNGFAAAFGAGRSTGDRPQLLLPPLQSWRFHDESTFRSLCRKQLILNDLMNWA